MGTSIKLVDEGDWGTGKQDWLASRMGCDVCRTITLDLALFTANHIVNGYIPSGTLLGKVTATGFYGPYVQGAGGDGRETNAGHLFQDVKMTSGDTHEVGAALYWFGIVKESNLPVFSGTTDGEIDAGARTDVAGHIRYEA